MKPGIEAKVLEELWKSPQNWKWGVYFCKQDPRVIVPKRVRWMGWTMNFARPAAIPTLLLMLAFLALPMFGLAVKGFINTPIWFATIVTEVIALCVACWYLASKKRY